MKPAGGVLEYAADSASACGQRDKFLPISDQPLIVQANGGFGRFGFPGDMPLTVLRYGLSRLGSVYVDFRQSMERRTAAVILAYHATQAQDGYARIFPVGWMMMIRMRKYAYSPRKHYTSQEEGEAFFSAQVESFGRKAV